MQGGPGLVWQPRHSRKKGLPLPLGHEGSNAVAFDARGQRLISGAAGLPFGGIGQAGRGAFQYE